MGPLWQSCNKRGALGGVLPKSESMKKMVAVGILCVLNLRILEPFHVAAGHRPALRDLGNTPSICVQAAKDLPVD